MELDGCAAGIDVGSTTTKVVIIDAGGVIVGQAILNSGGYFEERADAALDTALEQAGQRRTELRWITATGYGRQRVVGAQRTLTELTCHARGAYHHLPEEITVVDIGGQDNKILQVGADGRRGTTKMNRKCAAGTGAFIENSARQLGVECAELQELAIGAEAVAIGSFCTVFAGTEIIEQLRRGSSKGGIARGVLRAVALRVFEMGRFSGRVVLTGGVAQYFPLVAEELSLLSGCEVVIPPDPQAAGALGAALYARDGWLAEAGGNVQAADSGS